MCDIDMLAQSKRDCTQTVAPLSLEENANAMDIASVSDDA
jgi:hypothetical protein